MPIKLARHSAAVALLCGLAFAAPTGAQAAVEAGALSCRGAGAIGMVVTSLHQFSCVFRPAGGGSAHRYQATIRKVGLDLGVTRGEALGWIVLAPTRRVGPGDLAGSYGGVQGSASIGVGVGGNALVGGLNNSFALQPVSVQAQRGLNVAGGLASLELRYVRR